MNQFIQCEISDDEMKQALIQLTDNLKACNVLLTEQQLQNVARFIKILLTYNSVMNLTSITELFEVIDKHFYDCLAPLAFMNLKQGSSLIDIGAGGGFPSMPIIIARLDLNVTLLDTTNKKLLFLKEACENITATNASFLHIRAEEGARQAPQREGYNYVVSRAVANLRVLSEYCLPYLAVGGEMFAYKAIRYNEEIEDAKEMIAKLGGEITDVYKYNLICGDERAVIKITKAINTPAQYPRRKII